MEYGTLKVPYSIAIFAAPSTFKVLHSNAHGMAMVSDNTFPMANKVSTVS
jgi:hypothetical protein